MPNPHQLHSPHDEPEGHNPPPHERLVTMGDLRAMEKRLTRLLTETLSAHYDALLRGATKTLKASGAELQQAIDDNRFAQRGKPGLGVQPKPATNQTERQDTMAAKSNPTVDQFVAQIESTKTVMASGTALISGILARIQNAVDAALAGGATAADLAPVQDEITTLKAATDDMAAAILANTPSAPPTP